MKQKLWLLIFLISHETNKKCIEMKDRLLLSLMGMIQPVQMTVFLLDSLCPLAGLFPVLLSRKRLTLVGRSTVSEVSTHTKDPADALVWAQSYRFQTLASRNISESISVVPSCQVWDHLFTTALGKSYGYRYHFKQNSFMKNSNF